ncbi:hypothetical protein COO60DRAFT_478866 [Scenedesmus sp. NREL 46B-D3]|nr:hypothetical protein COO60DRAFT_478866 [Scenedesmus sp. NREL 46B-D3]
MRAAADHLAVRQGQQPAPLQCDKDCGQQARRHQIADAFGVEDAEQHAAYWDRHRTPTYSPVLLQAYKQDPLFIEQLERQLLEFLSPGSKAPRASLGAMPKAQRALAHEYAEAGFGLVSHSTGNEPHRAVQVFKTPSAGAPTQLLSQAAVLISQSAVDAMLRGLPANAAGAYTLRLVDVAPQAHLSHHLREWAGDYTLKTEAAGVVLLSFGSEKVYKAASETLAGGVRGVFRVERAPVGGRAAAAGGAAAAGSSSYRLPAVPSQQQQHNQQRQSGSSSRAAAPAGAGSLAGAAAAAGWQTVSAGKGRGADAAAAAPLPPDPWADDDKPSAAAARRRRRQHACRSQRIGRLSWRWGWRCRGGLRCSCGRATCGKHLRQNDQRQQQQLQPPSRATRVRERGCEPELKVPALKRQHLQQRWPGRAT